MRITFYYVAVSGLLVVPLMVLQWTGPCNPSPLGPICDMRVLDHFIMEARDTQTALRDCQAGPTVTGGSFVVPLTSVDFGVWETKAMWKHAEEVQSGLSLLSQTLGAVSASVTCSDLRDLLDNIRRSIQNLGQMLRRLHIQDQPPSSASTPQTRRVTSLSEILSIYTHFLRGKVRLLLKNAPACQQNAS